MEAKDRVNTVGPGSMEKKNMNGFGLITYLIAIGVLIAYGFFIHFLTGEAKAEEPEWSRLIYLFSGVEAIVFAAAGFLFGKEVNRKRAENAEEDKKQVQIEKKQVEIEKKQTEIEMKQTEKQKEEMKDLAVEERKNALILGAMAIQAEKSAPGVPHPGSALEGTTTSASATSLGSIAEKARKMYPELQN